MGGTLFGILYVKETVSEMVKEGLAPLWAQLQGLPFGIVEHC